MDAIIERLENDLAVCRNHLASATFGARIELYKAIGTLELALVQAKAEQSKHRDFSMGPR